MTRFPKEMTEMVFITPCMATTTFRISISRILLGRLSAAMAGCGKSIWKSIVPDCMNGFFFPVSCMTIWRKQIKSAGIVWNR